MGIITVWLNAHPALAAGIIWPLFTMLVNLGFDAIKAHESASPVLRAVDGALSAAGLDAGKLVAAVRGLFAPPPPPAGGLKTARPYDPEQTPTSPSRKLTRTMLAGVIMLAGCLPLRDALTFTADETTCVLNRTDNGENLAPALAECGIQNTPDALKFFGDLVADHQAAKAARACGAVK